MSGQQIGTVIGGAIGAYFGGPAGAQLGMAIGGMIGGAVDPTHINGPKIGDGQQQTATDGAAIAWVQGTAMVAGTICQVSSRRQIRHKDDGKGGGTVAVTFTAVQDFAVVICESSELRDSTVNSILMVLQDGKLVYDVRPGSTMLADSDKWKANVDFMFGDEEQLPHPTLEAITGVGNTPAYRGSCVAVFKNFDVSQAGDRIPSFQFVVSALGADELLNADFAVDATLASPAPAPDNSISYTLQPTDHLVLEVRDGMTYDAWRTHTYDAGSWTCAVTVAIDGGTPQTYFSTLYDSEAEAHAAAVLAGKIVLPSGGSEYVIWCADPLATDNSGGMSVRISKRRGTAADGDPSLQNIVNNICVRGGLSAADYEASSFAAAAVAGYPIARQANAADCLLPLLQAYFAYASEYDAQLHFKFYGADATVAIDRADLIEGNDSNKGAIVSNLRNQSTEFPRRIVAAYMDPAQNYTVVNVPAERQATDVIAIGDQSFQIPVVMAANDAAQAAQKALKVAYATLEGTLEYSTPFAGSDVYLSLAAGEPLQLLGKRYVADELILGNGSVKFTTRYDRQSAYTSNVQAIPGNAPTPPASPYSGPTALIPMNLPSLRPQDTYGMYLAAASTDGRASWQGCTVQVSYDSQASWQNALRMTEPSIFGALSANEPVGGEPLTAQVNGDLESATDDQLAANANAFALLHPTGAEIGQFKTAAETATVHEYELTNVTRGQLGTPRVPGMLGDQVVMLDAVYFLPVDLSFAGKTLYFRAIGFGEVAESAVIVSLVYSPDTTVVHDGGTVTP